MIEKYVIYVVQLIWPEPRPYITVYGFGRDIAMEAETVKNWLMNTETFRLSIKNSLQGRHSERREIDHRFDVITPRGP